jgi:PEP-CTERM motif
MNSSLKFLLAASATVLVSAPAYATNFNLVAVATGGGDYTYDVSDSAKAKGTFTDTFTFTIPGLVDGFIDVGLLNVANPTSNSNIDFISGSVAGTVLTALNAGSTSTISNDSDISVTHGLTYILSVTYKAAAKNAQFNGNISFTPTPTPEAATWAMMLLGFGMVGAGLRKGMRSKRNVAVSYS